MMFNSSSTHASSALHSTTLAPSSWACFAMGFISPNVMRGFLNIWATSRGAMHIKHSVQLAACARMMRSSMSGSRMSFDNSLSRSTTTSKPEKGKMYELNVIGDYIYCIETNEENQNDLVKIKIDKINRNR